MNRIFMNFKKKFIPGVALTLTFIVKQVYWYISQISGEGLQDHKSSACCHSFDLS